jgi:hypothetical protein
MAKFFIGYHSNPNYSEALVQFSSAEQADNDSEEWCEVEADSLQEAYDKYEETFADWRARCELIPSEKENDSAGKQVMYRETESSITYSTKKPEGTFYSDWVIRNGKLIALFEHDVRVSSIILGHTSQTSVLDVLEAGDLYSVCIAK